MVQKKNKYSGLKFKSYSQNEIRNNKILLEFFKNTLIDKEDLLDNLGLFFNSKFLSRILMLNELYKMILDTEGVIMELGVRWGQNLSVFTALRGIYEPYNIKRKIIGFDTFRGFINLTNKDGKKIKKKDLAVPKDHFKYLCNLITHLEKFNPVTHIKKHEIIKGDAIHTLKKYLKDNPQTIVSLAFFDFDIYKPTKVCLKQLIPHLIKGSVIAFDELNDKISPGETLAFKEVFKTYKIKLKRYRYSTRISYFIVE